jgi:hypothetical protein
MANRLLPSIAPTLAPAVAVRDAPDALALVRAPDGDVAGTVVGQVAASLERPGSIGVIVPPTQHGPVAQALSRSGTEWGSVGEMAAGRRVTLLGATEAKGLEFDVVVLVEPEALVGSAQPAALQLLYIAVTRAVLRLVVVHSGPLPDQLVRG